MCFNQETSLGVYLLGTASVIYLLYRGYTTNNISDIIAGWFLLPIVQMQIIEFVLWRNQKCNFTNKLSSLFIVLLLWIQPFSYFWVKYVYQNQKYIPKNEKIKKFSVLSVSTFIFGLAFYYCYKNFDKLCSLSDSESCRLVWKPMVLIMNYPFIFIILVISYFSMYFVSNKNEDKTNSKIENINEEPKYFLSNNIIKIVLIVAIIVTIYLKGRYFFGIFGSVFCFMCAFYGIFRILKI